MIHTVQNIPHESYGMIHTVWISIYLPIIFIIIMANGNESASSTTCEFIFFWAPLDTNGSTIDSNKD